MIGFDGDSAFTAMLYRQIERRALGEVLQRRLGSAIAGQDAATSLGVGSVAGQPRRHRGDVDDRTAAGLIMSGTDQLHELVGREHAMSKWRRNAPRAY